MMRMVVAQLHLYRGIEKILLGDWAKEIINATIGVCELLEKDLPGQTLQHISGGATRKGA